MHNGALAATAMTMTSREIAELTGKRHDNVMRDIRAMLAELVQGGLLSSEDTPAPQTWRHPHTGQTYEEFSLPKDLTITLVSGYSVAMRHRIVKRWQELESAASDPARLLSDPAFLRRVLLLYSEKLIENTQVARVELSPAKEADSPAFPVLECISMKDRAARLIEAGQLGTVEISRMVGCSDSYVRRIKRQVRRNNSTP